MIRIMKFNLLEPDRSIEKLPCRSISITISTSLYVCVAYAFRFEMSKDKFLKATLCMTSIFLNDFNKDWVSQKQINRGSYLIQLQDNAFDIFF